MPGARWTNFDEANLIQWGGTVPIAAIVKRLGRTETSIRQRACSLGISLYYMEVCSVGGCDHKHAANGLCRAHYQRMRRHGSLDLLVMRGFPVLGRIMAKVVVQP